MAKMTKWMALVLCTACAGEISDEMSVGTVESPLPAAGLEGFEHRMTVKGAKVTSRCTLSLPNWNSTSVNVLHRTNGATEYNAPVPAPGAPYPKTVNLPSAPNLKVVFSCESGSDPPCRMNVSVVATSRAVGDVLDCSIRNLSLVATSLGASADLVDAPKAGFRQSLSMNAARTKQQHMCLVSAADTSLSKLESTFTILNSGVIVLDEFRNDNGLLWKTEVPTAVGNRYAGQDGTDGQAQHVIPYAQGVIPGQLMRCRVPSFVTDGHEAAFNSSNAGNTGMYMQFQFATD